MEEEFKKKSKLFTNIEVFNEYEKEINNLIIENLELYLKSDKNNIKIFYNNFFPLIMNKKYLIEYNEDSIKFKKNKNYITFRPLRNTMHCMLILYISESEININNISIKKDNESNKYIFKEDKGKSITIKAENENEAKLIYFCKRIFNKDIRDLIKKAKEFDLKNNFIKI